MALKQRLLLIIFIAALASCGGKNDKIKPGDQVRRGPQGPLNVSGYVVKTEALSDNLLLPGSIIANEETEVHPEISGRLTYLNIAEGRTVGRGTLLAKIYDGDLQAQLNKLQVQLKLARQTTQRYAELRKIDGVSKQEYDLQALEISNIQADMAIVRSNIMRTRITAPFTGTLGLKNVSPGAFVTPATILTTIRQNSQLKLDFTVPETYASRILPGQMIDFSIEGSDKNYTARITATEMGLVEETRSLQARATIISKDKELLPGVFVKVKTNFDPNPNAIMIPSNAIISSARDKKVGISRDGKVVLTAVTTGLRDSAKVQILTGLKVGDTVITSALMSLKDGASVKVNTR